MRPVARVQKLEKKFNKNEKLSAIFIMRYYDDAAVHEKVKTAMLDDYLAKGHPLPHDRIFIQDAGSREEGFSSFMMHN